MASETETVIINRFIGAGAEKRRLSVFGGLHNRGDKVSVACYSGPPFMEFYLFLMSLESHFTRLHSPEVVKALDHGSSDFTSTASSSSNDFQLICCVGFRVEFEI